MKTWFPFDLLNTYFPVWTCFAVSVLFVKLFHLYLFVTIGNVADYLNNIFFLLGECHPLFTYTTTYVFQFSSGTVPLNFVWLSHIGYSLTINLPIVSFYFIHYPFVWIGTPFCLFFWVELSHFFVWMSHKYPLCPLPYLCVNVRRISLCLHYF